jgi:alpha-glucuronidase
MKNGQTLWTELCFKYDTGVQQVRGFQKVWDKTQAYVDADRFLDVQRRLSKQSINAQVWKDACLLYFQQFSNMPIPDKIEPPARHLDDIMSKNSTF